tara:strand:+ start:43 stop:1128 length:1086 start_codon:yes stop_codon:yes gene_type:complete
MTTATTMYALNHNQIAQLIATVGRDNCVLVQGETGTGKTSIQQMLARLFPNYILIYFDGTTKDMGDLMVPMFHTIGEDGVVRYATNEELGLHLDQPVILMIDEFGKCLPTVKNALTRLILERQLGAKKLHPDSLLWATTNLQAEGLGDMLPAHVRNRITTVEMRKPDAMEWIEWGVNNDIDPMILAWAKDTPQLFHSFKDCKPEENPYINHPQAQRDGFFTPRGGECASDILKVRDQIDDITLTASLMGTIGERGALDLMTYVALGDQLPSPQSIKDDPMSAKIPTAAGAVCMVVYRSLAIMDRQLIKPWMIYLNRLNKEAQGLFVNGARAKGYSKQDVVTQSKEFQDWCLANNFLFSADK